MREAAQFARFSGAAVRVAKRSTTTSTSTVKNIDKEIHSILDILISDTNHRVATEEGTRGTRRAVYRRVLATTNLQNRSFKTIINNLKSRSEPVAGTESHSAIAKSSATIVENWARLPVSAVALLLLAAHNIIICASKTGFHTKCQRWLIFLAKLTTMKNQQKKEHQDLLQIYSTIF